MNIDEYIKEKYLNMDKTDILVIHYQLEYQKMILEKYDFSPVPEDRIREIIYPSSWNYISSEAKLESLKEAIDNKITLLETEALNKYLKSL